MRASSNQAHVESHSQAMGCFSGSCFSQHAGLPAKRNGGDGWAASVQLRGAKCNFRKITQESETAEGLQACFTAGPAREYSSGSCEHNSHEISAGESDTRPLSHDQAKRFRKVATGTISGCLVASVCLLLLDFPARTHHDAAIAQHISCMMCCKMGVTYNAAALSVHQAYSQLKDQQA